MQQQIARIDPGRRRLAAACALAPALAAVFKPAFAWVPATAPVQRASRNLMGTRVDIVAEAPAGAATEAALAAAFAEMERLEQMMSRYRSGNPLAALQLAAGIQPVALPTEMLAVLKLAQGVSERSGGAFDISVGAFSGWHFEATQNSIPTAAELARETPLVDYRDLQLDPAAGRAYLRRRGMRLDLGGIAKLPILEAGMGVLRRHGIASAMLNGGGDVRIAGRLQGRPWIVGLRDPRAPQRLLGSLALEGQAWVAASGDYERGFWRDGRYYHHILDPRSGQPSRAAHGVTLVAREMEAVNGLGAALMVLGAARGRALLAPQVDALIVGPEQGLWLSPGMARRLHPA